MKPHKERRPRRRSKPDVEDPRRRERELKAALVRVPGEARALFDKYMGGGDPTALPGYEFVLAYLAAWTVHIEQGIRAVELLHRKGFPAHAAPLRRSLLEHAITCFTVASNPATFDVLLREHQTNADKYLKAARKVGINEDESTILEILDWEIDESTKSLNYLAAVRAKFEAFDIGGPRLYLCWLEETALSHANLHTADMFLRPTDDDDYPTLVEEPYFVAEPWQIASVCADSLLLALQSLSSITEGDPLAPDIEALHERRNSMLTELGSLLNSST
ncbi:MULTISPECIES: hypothetical protein [unclassified Aeromicrobium]|uniref:hypothetical protein n=1 Tax=unclassified Aeromicrobium TaxID=2633570 RepID=UPI00288BCECC|nr:MULTISPECIES: hypothetical protein [unclassified Aeromicrobium]